MITPTDILSKTTAKAKDKPMNQAVSYEDEGRREGDHADYWARSEIKAHDKVCLERHDYIKYRLNRVELFLVGELVIVIGGMGSIIYLLVGKIA